MRVSEIEAQVDDLEAALADREATIEAQREQLATLTAKGGRRFSSRTLQIGMKTRSNRYSQGPRTSGINGSVNRA